MPKNQSIWRTKSVEVINRVIQEADGSKNLIKLINIAYPFGLRTGLPYKVWLEERKKALAYLNLYKTPTNSKCKYHPNTQTCLICQNKNNETTL